MVRDPRSKVHFSIPPPHSHIEVAPHIIPRAGWNGAFYDFRNALSGDIIHTGTLALGSSGSDEICLGDGCYTLEVGAGDFQEEITWSFAPLSGGAPYGPAQFVANEGGIFENSTCNATD